jgi:RNA polymerase sigma-70 factor (ECF subfamily)
MTDQGDERALIERVLAGDEGAVAELYARHLPLVKSVLIRMVGRADADDLAQEVFVRALAHLGRFRQDASLKYWISRIAVHCGSRHLRGVRRAERRTLALEAPPGPPTPEDAVMEADERDSARQALARLPENDREILELRELLGLTYEEIQERLRVRHLGTVRSRLHKARESLRNAWRALGR